MQTGISVLTHIFIFCGRRGSDTPSSSMPLGFFKKFDIPNYDRAKGKESLYQEMILPVSSTQALLPNLIAFGLSDEHEK